jgi:hypothetical protein
MYVAADDGPYILASATDNKAGAPQIANADQVLYAELGKKKRGSAAGGDLGTTLLGPRVFDGVFAYEAMADAPTYAPTIDVAGLKVASATFVPVADAHVDNRGDPNGTFGQDAWLEVRGGAGAKVALLQFDLGALYGQTEHVPSQVLRATLRLRSSADTRSMFGGYVGVIPNGAINELTALWNTVPRYMDGGDEGGGRRRRASSGGSAAFGRRGTTAST